VPIEERLTWIDEFLDSVHAKSTSSEEKTKKSTLGQRRRKRTE
jgi:hypothetical protein